MRILEVIVIEDCFADSSMLELRLDGLLAASDVRALAPLGSLEYHPEFPRPFFRLRCPDGSSFKGVVGRDRIRVVLSAPAKPEVIAQALDPLRRALATPASGREKHQLADG